ncbi:MAG: LLM class flavin-dependent oxidoreductase [Chloroflexi bacterium]|nr:LLM class flavin-dependent oxidoreductase [Chloroflexota bacterium]
MELRERIGFSIGGTDISHVLTTIENAEQVGVRQIWMTQGPTSLDALTVYAAAMSRTQSIRLGTSIVPTYPRHPLALMQQAYTVDTLSPGRLRLGVGTSHRPIIERTYGDLMPRPLSHLKSYVSVLHQASHHGSVDYHDEWFTARAQWPQAPRIPILVATLGESAYHQAGMISDGAISWNTPLSFLQHTALPALTAGAHAANRPRPPLVAHAWISLHPDADAVIAATRETVSGYARLPFYANMFTAADFAVHDGVVDPALAQALVIHGDESAIRDRIVQFFACGIDEVLLSVVNVGDITDIQRRLFHLVGRM